MIEKMIKEYEDKIQLQKDTILKLQRRLRKYECFNEWENVEYFKDWSERSRIMSRYINNDCDSLLDLGCGEMHIKKYLPLSVKYYGVDYKKRDADTIVCDLASGEFPDIPEGVHTCFMAGVIEYLANWKFIFSEIARISKEIVLSYSTQEEAIERNPIWVNNIPEKELVDVITGFQFKLVDRFFLPYRSIGFHFSKFD